ncbi:MAG: YwaF family protein, partial [Schleiferiaceae bacterium]|nr:YwaF family protein [Schleiferiaceae bacterium]
MTFFQIEHAVYDMFSAPWLGGIAITATYALVVYFFSNKLKHDDLALTRFERIWGGLLIALFLVKHVQLVAIGDWSMTENMELHLCGMSRLLSILLLA